MITITAVTVGVLTDLKPVLGVYVALSDTTTLGQIDYGMGQ